MDAIEKSSVSEYYHLEKVWKVATDMGAQTNSILRPESDGMGLSVRIHMRSLKRRSSDSPKAVRVKALFQRDSLTTFKQAAVYIPSLA